MPHDWAGNPIPSKADNTTDIIGFGDVGGIGQIIYHTFRFKEYEYEEARDGYWCLRPLGEPEIDKSNGPSGKELFAALYNHARNINDFSIKKPFDEQVKDFCMSVAHPYYIDSLYSTMTDEQFVFAQDGEMLQKDAMFSVSDFMRDLGEFYNAAQFYFALKDVCSGDGEKAFALAQEGKLFEGLPFFEKYKHEEHFREYVLRSERISSDELIAEMEADRKAASKKPREEITWFAREPYDYFDELQAALLDIIPDFSMRLKINPKNKQVVFAADVHSVFDIAWYTLARMITDFGPIEEGEDEKDLSEGTLVTCSNCGEAFIRRNNRQQYCLKDECQKAHNAMRQKRYRDNKRLKDTRERD